MFHISYTQVKAGLNDTRKMKTEYNFETTQTTMNTQDTTKQASHTPGPWEATKKGNNYFIKKQYENGFILICENVNHYNAQLIARAPELLKENEQFHLLSAELTNSIEDLKELYQSEKKENEQLKQELVNFQELYRHESKRRGEVATRFESLQALNAELLEALNALLQHSPSIDPEMKEIPESMFSFTVTYQDYWKATIIKAKAEGKEQTKN